LVRPGGGTGRRASLRGWWASAHAGSIPVPGITRFLISYFLLYREPHDCHSELSEATPSVAQEPASEILFARFGISFYNFQPRYFAALSMTNQNLSTKQFYITSPATPPSLLFR
jgi:hypothetical protein